MPWGCCKHTGWSTQSLNHIEIRFVIFTFETNGHHVFIEEHTILNVTWQLKIYSNYLHELQNYAYIQCTQINFRVSIKINNES